MNTTNLLTFITVMQTGSISCAARRLYITQPAISKRIKNLEEEFGVVLFDTLGRGIMPTPAANNLLVHAKRWLDEYETCKVDLQDLLSTVSGRLIIGTSHHIGLHHLPSVLKQYIHRHAHVQLEVKFLDSEEAHKAVLEGSVQLAFMTLPPTFDRKLTYHPLWSDPLYFVTGSASPLASLSAVSLAQLADYPAILPAANTYTSQLTLAEFGKHGLRPYATMSTNPLESIRMLVSVGLGWSVLPKTLLNDELVIIDLKPSPALERQLGLVINPSLTRSASVNALLELLGITSSP